MNHLRGLRQQHGATLIVGLIMLVIITLLMVSAFMLSSTNLKSVGNLQSREEATAAANSAIEQVINGLDIPALPALPASGAAQPYDVHINNNSTTTPYHAVVTVQGCKRATAAASNEAVLSGVSSGIVNTNQFDTVWELQADVSDATTGTSVSVVQGIRQRMMQTDPNFSKCN